MADEVVRARRSATSNADALWEFQRGGESSVVDWCDAVDSQSYAEEN